MIKSLTKENYLDDLEKDCPLSFKNFNEWLLEYAERYEVGPKYNNGKSFPNLPLAFQCGVIDEYFAEKEIFMQISGAGKFSCFILDCCMRNRTTNSYDSYYEAKVAAITESFLALQERLYDEEEVFKVTLTPDKYEGLVKCENCDISVTKQDTCQRDRNTYCQVAKFKADDEAKAVGMHEPKYKASAGNELVDELTSIIDNKDNPAINEELSKLSKSIDDAIMNGEGVEPTIKGVSEEPVYGVSMWYGLIPHIPQGYFQKQGYAARERGEKYCPYDKDRKPAKEWLIGYNKRIETENLLSIKPKHFNSPCAVLVRTSKAEPNYPWTLLNTPIVRADVTKLNLVDRLDIQHCLAMGYNVPEVNISIDAEKHKIVIRSADTKKPDVKKIFLTIFDLTPREVELGKRYTIDGCHVTYGSGVYK